MKKYYLNRELSLKLGVPVAKWKRWSREFLPPDPIGGFRTGYARHFNLRDAFRVFLGGHLVSELRLTLHEAHQILEALDPWMRSEFLSRSGQPRSNCLGDVGRYEIQIEPAAPTPEGASGFFLTLRELEVFGPPPIGTSGTFEARYRLTPLSEGRTAASEGPPFLRVLLLSRVAAWFCVRLGLEPAKI